MISQNSVRVSSPQEAHRGWSRVRMVLWGIRNAMLVAIGLTLTFPVSAVGYTAIVYHIPYWRLPVENRDGSSAEEAVIVHADNETEGVRIEYAYAWYRTNPFADVLVSQGLVFDGGKTYDVLRFQNPKGEVETFWFDISEWYGAW